jgi:plasmid maintenance system antidote protein VapI
MRSKSNGAATSSESGKAYKHAMKNTAKKSEIFQNKLRNAYLKTKKSAGTIGEESGVCPKTVRKFLRNEIDLKIETQLKLAKAIKLKVALTLE